jgi:twinkle protein
MTAEVTRIEPYLPLYTAGFNLYRSGGLPRGSLTGWKQLDELYTVGLGQWTVVTGTPGSGKSEWLDALLVNLAERERWLFAVYSPENYPTETHLAKLCEKRARRPFNPGPNTRMTEQQYADSALWIMERFMWLSPDLKSPEELIATALSYDIEGRKLGIVLDPWNTLEHQRGGMSETDYVSFILTEVTKMARKANAHVWLVVHPAKIPRNKDGTRPVPTPYDISGSAHWYNKADNIVTIHRDQVEQGQDVEIHVQKVRFKHCGHPGLAVLNYDKVTGRYFEIDVSIAGTTYTDPERGRAPPVLREPGQEG